MIGAGARRVPVFQLSPKGASMAARKEVGVEGGRIDFRIRKNEW